MDSCETMEAWLSLRLDGMLDPEEERELEEHLAVCPRCRGLARELEAVHTAFPQLEEMPAPDGFAQGVMERVAALERRPKVVPLFRRPQVRALAGLAACAVLCIGLYRGGAFDWNRDAVEAATSTPDTAQYQEETGRSALEVQPRTGEEEAGQELQQEPVPADIPPQTENGVPDAAVREVPDGDVSGSENAASSQTQDGETETGSAYHAVQPSQFQMAAPEPDYTVAGQAVAAVLTLDRLPEGWEAVLGGTPEWLTDEAGRTCCILTADQLGQLEALAQQEGTISASLAGQASGEQSCALVLLETPQ